MDGFSHEVFFDVSGVGRKVPDVTPFSIGDRADRDLVLFGVRPVRSVEKEDSRFVSADHSTNAFSIVSRGLRPPG